MLLESVGHSDLNVANKDAELVAHAIVAECNSNSALVVTQLAGQVEAFFLSITTRDDDTVRNLDEVISRFPIGRCYVNSNLIGIIGAIVPSLERQGALPHLGSNQPVIGAEGCVCIVAPALAVEGEVIFIVIGICHPPIITIAIGINNHEI